MSKLSSVRTPSLRIRLTGLWLLIPLLAAILIAGGGSRSDLLGQVIVRLAAVLSLIVLAMSTLRPAVRVATVPLALVAAMIALNVLQLIPLPYDIWSALPGREIAVEAGRIAGAPHVARPISLTPAFTLNGLFSLVIPLAVLILFSVLSPWERRSTIAVIVLAGIGISALVALFQFSGVLLDNPLLNDVPGLASGLFANRNHQALFLACGIALAVGWAADGASAGRWRWFVASALSFGFFLMILATGSRAGLGALGISVAFSTATIWQTMRQRRRAVPRRIWLALAAGVVASLLLGVGATTLTGRAVSLDRIASEDVGQDMRSKALPVTMQILRDNFPFGGGGGSFDALYRESEPDSLLKPTYYNHAHNDVLEIVITHGLAAALLLIISLLWLARAGWTALSQAKPMAIAGGAIITMTVFCSVFDYPARTPIIMALVALAAGWLADVKVANASQNP